MTRSEGAAASYYLGHRSEFAFLTLEAAAARAGVSTTTVIRFCRRVGFSGYKSFQEAVREEVRRLPGLPDKYIRAKSAAAGSKLTEETLRSTLAAVEQSFAKLCEEDAEAAVSELDRAERIFCFGMKESAALAHYAYTRFLSVRGGVFLLTGPGEGELETLFNIGKKDVCLVFLFHRYTRTSTELLPVMRRRGAKIILVTNPPPDCADADTVLLCEVDAGGIKNSFAAPVILTDCLCGALAFRRGEAALSHMRAAEELLAEKNWIEG
jgi:DNA-binding MurR/RpiR family transcriptional regulator